MVELTEIKEENQTFDKEAQEVRPGTTFAEAAEGDNSTEDESSDDEYDEEETFYERLCALKEIVAPKQRQAISNVLNVAVSTVKSAFSNGGNLVWALTTSALLLGVPLSLSILAEQQLIEMEKGFDLQKDANDILAQGEPAQTQSIA